MWSITERFPTWGEDGEFPVDGFFYEGGDQVNEKHLDALWNGLKEFENETRAALEDIDSDGDGKVNSAEYADNADTVDGEDASAFANSEHNHDGRYARLYDGVQAPVYASTSDVPSGIGKGEFVYIDGDGLYVEDGN
ncbi:hypothetical protein HAPG_00023 [Halorubrum phage GNf2]|nr:hypothetical protein HAPG_00023 [Halorubrum phage GNf2]